MDFIFLHQGNNKTMQISVSVKTPLKSLTQTYKLNYVFSFNVLCFHFLMFFLTFFSPLNYHFIFNLLNCLFFSLFSSFISCFLLNSFFFLLFSALISFFSFFIQFLFFTLLCIHLSFFSLFLIQALFLTLFFTHISFVSHFLRWTNKLINQTDLKKWIALDNSMFFTQFDLARFIKFKNYLNWIRPL